MSQFEGRVLNQAQWKRVRLWRPSPHGYVGKPSPVPARNSPCHRGEVEEKMTTAKVVKTWIKTLKAQGLAYQVEDDGTYTTVRSIP